VLGMANADDQAALTVGKLVLLATSDRTCSSATTAPSVPRAACSSVLTAPCSRRMRVADLGRPLPLLGAEGPRPQTAVTSRKHLNLVRLPERGRNWQATAVSSHERSQEAGVPGAGLAAVSLCQLVARGVA
jgi:hypothetical protein